MANRQQIENRYREQEPQRRALQRQVKRSRNEDRVRRRDWVAGDEMDELEAYDRYDSPAVERMRPRGERERRKANAARAAEVLEAEVEVAHTAVMEFEQIEAPPAGLLLGLVLETGSGLSRVAVGGTRLLKCTLRGALTSQATGYTNVVAAGDRVHVTENGAGGGVIEQVLPRRNALARPDVFYPHLQQVIAANVDQLLIVASWRNPALWPELIDRYLIAAQRDALAPVICVNKVDLAEDVTACRMRMQPYRALGLRTVYTSALSGYGIDELRNALANKTTVVAGLSGVGKSSLLARVQPGLALRVGDVNTQQHLGRHTTSQATMIPLAGNGFVVDTPGIKEFGLGGLSRSDLAAFYPELVTLGRACRFGDCLHLDEPGCAVQSAVHAGKLGVRYDNYRKILQALPA